MNNNDINTGRAVFRGKPFIGHNVDGHTVILCEETTLNANQGKKVGESYTTKLIVNENPSAAEIFKARLINPNR